MAGKKQAGKAKAAKPTKAAKPAKAAKVQKKPPGRKGKGAGKASPR